jgi:hypothetical protein
VYHYNLRVLQQPVSSSFETGRSGIIGRWAWTYTVGASGEVEGVEFQLNLVFSDTVIVLPCLVRMKIFPPNGFAWNREHEDITAYMER